MVWHYSCTLFCYQSKQLLPDVKKVPIYRGYITDLHKNKQQQQNFINKQITLQKYCPQLTKLFEAGQCVQNINRQCYFTSSTKVLFHCHTLSFA